MHQEVNKSWDSAQPGAEQGTQPLPPVQQATRKGISRRTLVLSLVGIGGAVTAGIAFGAGPLYRFIQKLTYPAGLIFVSDEFGSVDEVAWSPDGTRVAFGGLSSDAQHSTTGTIQVWNVLNAQRLFTLSIPTAIDDLFDLLLTWSPDGKHLLAASSGAVYVNGGGRTRTVHTWDMKTGQHVHSFASPENAAQVWALTSRYLAIVMGKSQEGNIVQVFDTTDGHLVSTLNGPFLNDGSLLLRWGPDERRLAIVNGGGAGSVQIWDALTANILLSAQFAGAVGGEAPAFADDRPLAWSPDGKYLAAIKDEKHVAILDTTTGQVVYTSQGDGNSLQGLAWSPGKQGRLAFSSVLPARKGSLNNQTIIYLCEAFTNKPIHKYAGPDDVPRLAFSPDGKYLAVAGGDRLHVWQSV